MDSLPVNTPVAVIVTWLIIRDIIFPIAKAIIPIKQQEVQNEGAQNNAKIKMQAEDQKFSQDMKRREVEALEKISGFMGVTNERLQHIETDTKEIKDDVRKLQLKAVRRKAGN